MKKTVLALTLATSVFALSACSDKEANNEDIFVTTNVGNITKADLYEEMKDAIGIQVIENLVLQKVLENEYKITDSELKKELEARKAPYGDQFELYLMSERITENFFDKNVKSSLLQQKLISSLEVSDEEINELYEKMKKEIHARHILVKDKKTAEEVITKLNEGGDFAELAKEYSTEPIAQTSGGDLGWFGVGKMVIPFEEAAFALPVNEISEPVESSFGFHIIEVLETREAELDTFEVLEPKIKEQIMGQKFEEKLESLLKKADIDIKIDEYKSVLDVYLPNEK